MLLVTIGTPQGLYSDTGWQMLALKQFLDGESPSLNHLVQASPEDLSQSKAGWITVWAPSTQLLVYPLVANGLSIGRSIRVVQILALVAGTVGWLTWLTVFRIPRGVSIPLGIGLPWMHYASNGFFLYSAESLAYGYFPWLLLCAYRLSRSNATSVRPRTAVTATTVGLLVGMTYALKYAMVIPGVGILIFVMIRTMRRRLSWMTLAFAIAGFSVPVSVLVYFNHHFGLAHSVITSLVPQVALLEASDFISLFFRGLIHVVGEPALMLADADAGLLYLLLNPQHGVTQNHIWVAALGLPGGVLLGWLIIKRGLSRDSDLLAVSVFFTGLTGMLIAWCIAGVSYEGRHLAIASLTILPFGVEEGVKVWNSRAVPALRFMIVCAGLLYVAAPLVYGMVSVAGKIFRERNYVVGRNQLYNPFLAKSEVEPVVVQLTHDFDVPNDVWYLTEPFSALDLPGRAILRHADFLDLARLSSETFGTSRPVRVHALLPTSFETNGKGQVIRSSFTSSSSWEREEIQGSAYVGWVTLLKPRDGTDSNLVR